MVTLKILLVAIVVTWKLWIMFLSGFSEIQDCLLQCQAQLEQNAVFRFYFPINPTPQNITLALITNQNSPPNPNPILEKV